MTIRSLSIICYLVITVSVAGCATHYSADAIGDPYGFFSGLWHGFLFPYALTANIISWLASVVGISIFDSIQIVGRPNTGFWYFVGFAFGLCSYSGGAAR